jgi:hypothetical protein
VVLGTGSPGVCLSNNSAGHVPPEPVVLGVGLKASSLAVTPSEDVRPRSCHPVGILSAPAPARGAGWRNGGAVDQHDPLSYPALRTNGNDDVEFIIPGTGKVTDETLCGSWSSTHACSKEPGHYLRTIKHSCDNPSCPVCFPSWISKASRRIAERVRGYIGAANDAQVDLDGVDLALWHKDNTRYLNHYVGSPRPGEITPDMPYNAIKQRGRAMAARIGITGAVQVFHPCRIRKALQPLLSAKCRGVSRLNEEDREKKFWELVREDALHLGSWKKYVVWSPHFHYIGFGRLPEQVTPEQKEECGKRLAGWVFRWIRHVDTERSFDGQEMQDPIAALAAYLLSHAGYLPGKKIPSWCGVLGPNHLKKIGDPDHMSEPVVCPRCGSPVILYDPSYGQLIPRLDPDTGGQIPYRLRYCNQKYEIKRRFKR